MEVEADRVAMWRYSRSCLVGFLLGRLAQSRQEIRDHCENMHEQNIIKPASKFSCDSSKKGLEGKSHSRGSFQATYRIMSEADKALQARNLFISGVLKKGPSRGQDAPPSDSGDLFQSLHFPAHHIDDSPLQIQIFQRDTSLQRSLGQVSILRVVAEPMNNRLIVI